MGFLIPPHPLTNFEVQKYQKNEPRFNGVFSRYNLPKKIKDAVYVINVKNFNSFINEFDRATNKEDKEKVAKELKDINNLVEHYIEMDESNEYRSKLFDIANTIEYFLYEYSKK